MGEQNECKVHHLVWKYRIPDLLKHYGPKWDENGQRLHDAGYRSDPRVRFGLYNNGDVEISEDLCGVVVGVMPAALDVIAGILPPDLERDCGPVLDISDPAVLKDAEKTHLWIVLAWFYCTGEQPDHEIMSGRAILLDGDKPVLTVVD